MVVADWLESAMENWTVLVVLALIVLLGIGIGSLDLDGGDGTTQPPASATASPTPRPTPTTTSTPTDGGTPTETAVVTTVAPPTTVGDDDDDDDDSEDVPEVDLEVRRPTEFHVDIDGMVPGETETVVLELTNHGRATGVVTMSSSVVNHENGVNDPEARSGDTSAAHGELGSRLLADISVDEYEAVQNATASGIQLPRYRIGSGGSVSLVIVLHLPTETSNVVQSDSIDITYHFTIRPVRVDL